MSEISMSKKGFGLSFVSHLFHFFFFLLSHPLYFSYFIFFFPYFLKLLSFLSPLFITTFLLLFSFFTLFFPLQISDFFDMAFLSTSYQFVFDSFKPTTLEQTDGFPSPTIEHLEAYQIMFESYTFAESEEQIPFVDNHTELDFQEPMENFPEQSEAESKETQIEDLRKMTEESSVSSRTESSPWSSPGSFSSSSREYNNHSLGSYGSMRKEKEWRRTLACKLFEERHNSEGGTEGMDSLWETYENSESKNLKKKEKINGKLKMKGKKIQKKEDEEEEEEEEEGQLCCLQALKFSAGKMNLGMGKPNLLKMSKALKGFGWFNRKRMIH